MKTLQAIGEHTLGVVVALATFVSVCLGMLFSVVELPRYRASRDASAGRGGNSAHTAPHACGG